MFIIAIVFIVVVLFALLAYGYWYLSKLNKKKENVLAEIEIKEPTSSFVALKDKENSPNVKNDADGFFFDIFSIVFKEKICDVMIIFENRSNQHIRIDIEKVTLYVNKINQTLAGDFSLKELNMGTNDIILKNTILIDSDLVRNIYFENLKVEDFTAQDTITIELLINGQKAILKNSLAESSILKFEIINNIN